MQQNTKDTGDEAYIMIELQNDNLFAMLHLEVQFECFWSFETNVTWSTHDCHAYM